MKIDNIQEHLRNGGAPIIEEIPSGNIHGGWTFADGYLFGFDTLHSNSKTYMDAQWVLQHLKEYIDEILEG